MLKPVNSIIRDSVGNIIHREFVVTGEVAIDNGDGSYDVFIAEEAKAYPRVFTLARNPDLAVGDKVRILYKNGCRELPIILPPVKPTAITGEWVLPTGHIDYLNKWWNETRMYDGSLEFYCGTNVTKASWSSFIGLTIDAIPCNSVRLWVAYYPGHVDKIDIDAYYDKAWNDIYEGDYAHAVDESGNPLEWYEKELDSIKTITIFRFRFYNSSPISNYGVGIYEVEFFKVDI